MAELMNHPAVFIVIGAMSLFALVLGSVTIVDALQDH